MNTVLLQPPPISPALDLFAEVERLKRELNAVILAHYYQDSDIQDLADFVGDSLQLSQQAKSTKAEVIVFAGVHFMAETAKILNPDKQVLLPDLRAGCSLSDTCPADRFAKFIADRPGHVVISYVNCSAAVKALSDILCTSSNAELVIRSVPAEKPIIFAPDQNLGRYLEQKTGRKMVLWPGTCMVHDIFSEKKLVQLKVRYPDAPVAAHPECPESVLAHADHIGSTSSILDFVIKSPAKRFIIVTEPGIIHQMERAAPEKEFIPAPPTSNCACNECPHMKLNTLEKLYLCMRDRRPAVLIPEEIRRRALIPLERMLEISAQGAVKTPD
ncbi:MAG TPA: quinolinate synthase NadA [Candidatus Udaeobacter sp.]|nr:quinolinate synthase NadA [Candidatus Udaeobacter sp.]